MTKSQKYYLLKYTGTAFMVLAIFLGAYVLLLPFYPLIKYQISPDSSISASGREITISQAKEQIESFKNSLPDSAYAVSPNRLIIPRIGVNAPIVEALNEKQGLSKGAWRLPDSSTPDQQGNTVITGHRFKYLPPNNLTFFLFDKLSAGDPVYILWEGQDIYYRVKETKIVPDTEMSILDQTPERILTLFTCHPIYSTEKRLVIIAEPATE